MRVTKYWAWLPNLMISLCVVAPAFAQDATRAAKDAALVHPLIEAIKLRSAVAEKQHGSEANKAPPVLCPAALVGTWTDEKGLNDGVLAVEKDSITGGSLTGKVTFRVDCNRIAVAQDGGVSFTAQGTESLFANGDIPIQPTVTITKSKTGLAIHISGFKVDQGLSYISWSPQEHTLARFDNLAATGK